MTKNNIRVFISYLFVILLSFALLFFLNRLFVNSMIRLNNVFIKAFFLLLYVLSFYFLGKTVSIKERPRNDFFSYFLVFFLGLIVLIFASLSGNLDMTDKLNIMIFPAQVFLSPYNFILGIFGMKINFFNYIILSLINAILIGLSTKRKRVVNRYKR